MNPFVYYLIAAVLFVLGLAAIGGATFGKLRHRRIALAVAGVALWAATLWLYSQAASLAPAEPEPTPTPVMQEPTPALPATAEPQPTEALNGAEEAEPLPAIGGRIAFHSDRDGDLDIYAMEADGSNVQRLTDAEGRDFEPHWSPDGSTIVFSTDRDDPDNAQLYLMGADGSNQRRLPSPLTDDQVGGRWSPDGQWILFHSNPLVDGLPRFEVFKIRPDGSDLTQLTNTPGNNFMGDWSPDGQRITFVSQRDGNRQIYVMDADGGNQVRLTDGNWENSLPRWSPDGERIIFESDRSGSVYGLFLIDAPDGPALDGAQEITVRMLTFPGFNHSTPAWVGAGDWLIISSDRNSTNMINWELYLLKADGSEIYRLTDNPALDRYPAWTP